MAKRRPAHEVVDGYELLFDPVMRDAHTACLLHARAKHEDRWPTIASCIAIAKLFGVPAAELAAFFGYIGYVVGNQTTWVDVFDTSYSSHMARQLMTDKQATALGYQMAFDEVVRKDVELEGLIRQQHASA